MWWWTVAYAVYGVFWGLICSSLAEKKGLNGYYWIGFFLGIVGFIYVVALPANKDAVDTPTYSTQQKTWISLGCIVASVVIAASGNAIANYKTPLQQLDEALRNVEFTVNEKQSKEIMDAYDKAMELLNGTQ